MEFGITMLLIAKSLQIMDDLDVNKVAISRNTIINSIENSIEKINNNIKYTIKDFAPLAELSKKRKA